MRENKIGLGLKVVEDNVKIPNPNLPRDIKIASETSKLIGQCSICPKKVDFTKFKSQSDHDEHEISGMCKTCMNKTFGYERRA